MLASKGEGVGPTLGVLESVGPDAGVTHRGCREWNLSTIYQGELLRLFLRLQKGHLQLQTLSLMTFVFA
jgi:hypothetical protein